MPLQPAPSHDWVRKSELRAKSVECERIVHSCFAGEDEVIEEACQRLEPWRNGRARLAD